MHAPDGFLDPVTTVATAALAIGAVGVALRRSGGELGEREVPVAGVTAAFLFAAQMVNFPVAAGTSGHLIGAALASILLGPSVGVVVATVVVVVQALAFADGGLTALGYNTLNMAVIPGFGAAALFASFRRLLPPTGAGVVAASGLAAGLSIVLSAAAFSLEWLFGATAPVPFDTVFGAMVAVHAVIGAVEGLVTALIVGAVLAARPELVAGARDLDPAALGERRLPRRAVLLAALVSAVVMASAISQLASTEPDGLERVAEDTGFASSAEPHLLEGGLFADYATDGIADEGLSAAVAGSSGIVITLAVGYGLTRASTTRLRRSDQSVAGANPV